MKIRVAKCCPFVSLRWGCFAIAFFDTSFHIVNLEMCNSDALDTILICIYVIHALGCFLLIISAVVQMSHLVIVYLISNVVQTLFFVATVYIWIKCKENSVFEIAVTFVDISLSAYFWIVAYSYLRVCKERVPDAYLGSASKYSIR
ncbi:hypothetical protein ACLKA6_000206 [Drosophila palustris]